MQHILILAGGSGTRLWPLSHQGEPKQLLELIDGVSLPRMAYERVAGLVPDANILVWQAVLFGPDDPPWEGGTFKLELTFSEDYPNKAPAVRFATRVFHPNVYNDGQICLDILQNQWSPIYDISAILTSIQSLLSDPNPASPANSEASRLYSEHRREYDRRVREVVEQSWQDEPGEAPDDGGDEDDSDAMNDDD